MELELNIYNRGKIDKTYKATSYTLTTGVVLDVLHIIDFDKVVKLKDKELGLEILKIIQSSQGTIQSILLDTFDGLTEDEIKKTKIEEVVAVLYTIIRESVKDLNLIDVKKK